MPVVQLSSSAIHAGMRSLLPGPSQPLADRRQRGRPRTSWPTCSPRQPSPDSWTRQSKPRRQQKRCKLPSGWTGLQDFLHPRQSSWPEQQTRCKHPNSWIGPQVSHHPMQSSRRKQQDNRTPPSGPTGPQGSLYLRPASVRPLYLHNFLHAFPETVFLLCLT